MKGEYLKLLLSFLEEFISKQLYMNKKIIIFGANAPGSIIINYLERNGINTIGVIDNNEKVQGKLFMDIKICNPEDVLKKYNDDYLILISSRYYEEMKKQLESFGYIENKHFIKTLELGDSINFSLDDSVFNEYTSKIYRGLEVYKKIVQKYNKQYIVMVPVKPNGDVYIICSYIREYVKKIGLELEDIVLTVIGQGCYKVAELFEIPFIAKLSLEDSNNLSSLAYLLDEKIKLVNPYFSHLNFFKNIDGYKELNFVDDIKLGIMNLEDSTLPFYPKFKSDKKEIDFIFDDNHLTQGKTVILAPYAYSIPQIRWTFWEKLANQLLLKGYDVCTNCGSQDEKPIKGTKPIYFTFNNAVEFCNKAGYIIAYRSGFCDIIAQSNAKRIIIYPDHAIGLSELREIFAMKDKVYNQDNLFEVVNEYENTEILLKKIIEYI